MMRTGVKTLLVALAVIGAGLVPGRVQAQNADSVVRAGVARARELVEQGDGPQARLVLDSLVRGQEDGTDALAEALFWRAALGESAADAERDWKRLVMEAPLAPRAPDALLRLAELELMRAHPDVARRYLERVVRDHADAPERAKASLWIARSYIDEGDGVRGCGMVELLRRGALPEGELQLQGDALHNRCTSLVEMKVVTAATIPDVTLLDSVVPRPSATAARASVSKTGRYTVQLAAYGTRREAEAGALRLARVLNATVTVEGMRKPFRVRTGRYATRAEATKAVAALRKRGIKAIVADVGT